MNSNYMTKPDPTIKGIIPPLITPLKDDLSLDTDAFSRLIEHVIKGGVNGIFILGTNGECASLTDEIRYHAIQSAVKFISNRVPLFVNISSCSYKESLQLADYAAKEGADFVVLTPPYYFYMDQPELARYYEAIATYSPIPLFMYNAPQYTKNLLEPENVCRLAQHDNILGIKDSSGNVTYLNQLLENREDPKFRVFVGPELLLGEFINNGGDGGVNGGANLFPELYVKMYQVSQNGDGKEQARLQEIMKLVDKYIYQVAESPMGIVIGLKYALSLTGICSETMAMPVYNQLKDHQKEIINEFLKETAKYGI